MEVFFIFLMAVYMFWVFIMTVPMLLECMYLLFRTTKYDIDDLDGYIQDSWVVIFVSFVGLFSGIFAFGLNPYALNIPALWFVFISYSITMLLAWIANKKFKNELSESIAKLNYTDEHKSMYCGCLSSVEKTTETESLKNEINKLQEKLAKEEEYRKRREQLDREQREEERKVIAEKEEFDNLCAQEEIDSLINEIEEVEQTDKKLEQNTEVDNNVEPEENTDEVSEPNEPNEPKEPNEPEAEVEPVEVVEDIEEKVIEENKEFSAEKEATEESTIILADEEKPEELQEAEI